jgi:rRNA-processing protein FCF1
VVDDLAAKIRTYRRSGVLVDTNLLLVYFVGLYDTATGYQLINAFKYTKGTYTAGDFDILLAFLQSFRTVVTTPHILAEVSNSLSGALIDPARDLCLGLLQQTIPSFQEHHVPAEELIREDRFRTYGITDMGIQRTAAGGQYLVLTDDYRLAGYLQTIGIDTLSFPEIKYS